MLDKFLSYIEQENLCNLSDSILLAVSGGVDSMVMAHLFRQAGFKVGIVHVNHGLRDLESDSDEMFVRNYSQEHDLPFFDTKLPIDLLGSGNMHQISRKFRYSFFNTIALENNYSKIATAHHKDDVVETMLINLIRGTGLKGLSSIPNKNMNIIRPLLFASKTEISTFAKENEITYREDSSNDTDKYLRNYLRHQVVPHLYDADPRAKTGLIKTIANMQKADAVLNFLLSKSKDSYTQISASSTIFHLDQIKNTPCPNELLYYLLVDYGANESQCIDILREGNRSGKHFQIGQSQFLLDRNQLILSPNSTETWTELTLSIPSEFTFSNRKFTFEMSDYMDIMYDDHCQYICLDNLAYPIVIRKWRHGDRISSLGMNGKNQKVKDILINAKMNQMDKENVLVLESGHEIIAIIGYRISENVKVTTSSKNILRIMIV